MDVNQVNSRHIHDETPIDPPIPSGDAEKGLNGDASFSNYAGYPDNNTDGGDGPPGSDGTTTTDLERYQTAVSTASHQETYPEGGTQAWMVVVGSWFAMFAGLGLMNTLAAFQAYTVSHQLKGYSEGTVGWIFSIYTFLAFFCGVYIGPVFDKYGPTWLVMMGSVCVVAGVLLMSFCTGMSPLVTVHQQPMQAVNPDDPKAFNVFPLNLPFFFFLSD